MPYVNLTVAIMVPKIKIRLLDNVDPYKTKKTSMAQFINLHLSPEYFLHFKYSDCLNVVYITFMYGIGMPVLFPIAALAFLNNWICERLIVSWYMRLPPALDDHLIKNILMMLKYAPMIFVMNGYWMISN